MLNNFIMKKERSMRPLAKYQPLIGSQFNALPEENNYIYKDGHNQRKQHLKTSEYAKCNILKISSLIDLDTNI